MRNHKGIPWAGFAAVMFLAGCQRIVGVQRVGNTPPEELSATPLLVDEAMQLREWNRSTAAYANGDVPAGSCGFPFRPSPGQAEWKYALLETPLFLGQVIILPGTIWFPPPWTCVTWTGVTTEATHHAMPVLPSSPVAAPAEPAAEPAPMEIEPPAPPTAPPQ